MALSKKEMVELFVVMDLKYRTIYGSVCKKLH